METIKQQAIQCMQEGRYADAVSFLVKLEKDEIKDWTLYYALGQCYRFSGQLTLAHQFLETAKQINRLNAEIAYAYAEVCELMMYHEEAIRAYEDVISLHSNRVAAYNKIGLIYARMDNLDEAMVWFQRAMKQISILENAGITMSDESYLQALKTKMELDYVFPHAKPEDTMDLPVIKAVIMNSIGVCHFQQDNHDEAKKYFKKSIALLPYDTVFDDPKVYLIKMDGMFRHDMY